MALQTNRLSATSIWYSLINMCGSGLILFSLFFAWNLSAAIVEGLWVLISAYGVFKALRMRAVATKDQERSNYHVI